METNIHASSGIRSHDPSAQAGEDISCLRPRSHCDRQVYDLLSVKLHMPGSSCPSINAIKPKVQEYLCTATILLFYMLQEIT
jgi:hypothetical protein